MLMGRSTTEVCTMTSRKSLKLDLSWCVAPAALLAGCLLLGPAEAVGSEPRPNYDESKVPKYTLPDPLVLPTRRRPTDAATW